MKQCFTVLRQAQWGVGSVLTCDSAHSWCLYSAALLWGIRPSHSVILSWHCTNKSCPILIMQSTRLGSDKYQFKTLWFDSIRVRTHEVWIRTWEVRIPWSPRMGGGCSTHSTGCPFTSTLVVYNLVIVEWLCGREPPATRTHSRTHARTHTHTHTHTHWNEEDQLSLV